MSLQNLSTELDLRIVEHCNLASLLPLSSCSRYWQSLSEPRLYENICTTVDDAKKAKVLLNLLKWPVLAQYIKIVFVDLIPGPNEESERSEYQETNDYEEERNHSEDAQDAKLTESGTDPSSRAICSGGKATRPTPLRQATSC